MKDVFATKFLESNQKHGKFRLIFYQREDTENTEGLDSYGCFSIENHKFICVCLKNSILETMSLQQSCWNLILIFLFKVC